VPLHEALERGALARSSTSDQVGVRHPRLYQQRGA
jgi:hypothetical protein